MEFLKNTELLPQICEIYFATTDQVQGYLTESPYSSMPVISAGTWAQLYFTPDTIDYSGGHSDKTVHGSLYEYSLSIGYPGIDPDHLNPHQFASLDQYKWIILLVYTDGKMRTIGSVAQGLSFFWMEGTSSSKSGFTLSWKMTDTKPAQNLGYVAQFFINSDQYLVQRYSTNINYTLTEDKVLEALGPDADQLIIKEGYLQFK